MEIIEATEISDDKIIFKTRDNLNKAWKLIESNTNFIIQKGDKGKLIIADVMLPRIKNNEVTLHF